MRTVGLSVQVSRGSLNRTSVNKRFRRYISIFWKLSTPKTEKLVISVRPEFMRVVIVELFPTVRSIQVSNKEFKILTTEAHKTSACYVR